MWAIIFVAFLSIAGSNGSQSECMKRSRIECEQLAMELYNPQSDADMDEECSVFIQQGKCVIAGLERCNGDENTISISKKILNYVEEICNPDNEIYKELKEHTPCLMSAIDKTEFCSPEEFMSEKNIILNNCQSSLVEVACQAIGITKKCGEVSKDAILGLLMNTNFDLKLWCTEKEISLSKELTNFFIEVFNRRV